MSKKVKYPNGYIGVASDKAAAILAKKKGHEILGEVSEPATKPDAKKAKE
jgi:hypothetical protein